MESVKIPASKMAARNRVQYHPPPPISFCEGPRIIQKLKDVVVQILELPLYISILFGEMWQCSALSLLSFNLLKIKDDIQKRILTLLSGNFISSYTDKARLFSQLHV